MSARLLARSAPVNCRALRIDGLRNEVDQGRRTSARRRNSDRCSRIASFNRARRARRLLFGDRSIDAPFAYRPSGGELPISAAVWGALQDAWVAEQARTRTGNLCARAPKGGEAPVR